MNIGRSSPCVICLQKKARLRRKHALSENVDVNSKKAKVDSPPVPAALDNLQSNWSELSDDDTENDPTYGEAPKVHKPKDTEPIKVRNWDKNMSGAKLMKYKSYLNIDGQLKTIIFVTCYL